MSLQHVSVDDGPQKKGRPKDVPKGEVTRRLSIGGLVDKSEHGALADALSTLKQRPKMISVDMSTL